ncbi:MULTISPECIES: ribonuclease J [unclassified Clostridium]|uniref:ribonuclease J n=1 Tax=Clostridium TaxID=1485 RepID=UPI001C8C31DB|nr:MULTISPECIES: ribonuclease J [unclassified Clostridium]MBX9136945.1 ribonuclease J [Clostridium sp. K12(2020)]MBX9143737.1 ribonuclease J [Clostridium sp. K13]MDU2291061.1 ribonuclease J [Clostridium celatum]
MESKKKIKVIPLGGLGEVGKNITVIEYGEEIIVVDCGMTFPDSEMYGIDVVIPDVTYLVNNKERVKGFFITHGHEDHIGAIPYILKQVNAPIYATNLTVGLIKSKLEEHKMLDIVELNVVNAGDTIALEKVKVEFIRTNHSIADSCALAIHTPLGIVVHTGDIKVDFTPVDGKVIDLQRLAKLGKQGVLLLMADSTNACHPGYTMSEKTVGETLDNLFSKGKGRIIVATFASNIHRLQQIINSSIKYGRKIAFSGRSMEKISDVAIKLGYLNMPEGLLIDLKDLKLYNSEQITIVTTGSQGEPMSALTRMASSTHKNIQIEKDDMIIISANPIPGNEKAISKVINELTQKGANVIYKSIEEIHVSGHACEQELKLLQSILKPKYFVPVHGEYKHLRKHILIAEEVGLEKGKSFILENGDVLSLNRKSATISGKVQAGNILVDGIGVGDVGNIVLRDRKNLSKDGIINIIVAIEKETKTIASGPDIVTRGFIYVRESEELVNQIKEISYDSIQTSIDKNIFKWSEIKNNIRNDVGSFIYSKTKRKPIIVPIIMEV